MRHFRKNEKGFTLIELLIVVVIIGILAAVGVPIYTRYITSARAAEAPTIMMAIREYAQSYLRAHPTTLFGTVSTDLLYNSYCVCPTAGCSSGDSDNSSGTWLKQVVGDDAVYFDYIWQGGGTSVTNRIIAKAKSTLGGSAEGNEMIFAFTSTGGDAHWSASPTTSKLVDVLPEH